MRTVTKARVVAGALIGIALWPIVHRQLVVHYDINPWKLYGFAMYCTPHGVAVDLVDRSVRPPRRIEPDTLPPPARAAYDAFVERRRTLGRFVSPDDMAGEVLRALPEVRRLTVAVGIFSLQWREDRLTPRRTFYRFDRVSLE